ncbi:hypothetical protein DFH08DRAFT_634512, partial [Mycena albidolilacea]
LVSSASPFFSDMFSLPQPDTEAPVPLILIAETGRLLDRFLRLWYPGAKMMVFDGLHELDKIIELALSKYDMQCL